MLLVTTRQNWICASGFRFQSVSGDNFELSHPTVLLVMPQEKYGFAQQMLVFVAILGRI